MNLECYVVMKDGMFFKSDVVFVLDLADAQMFGEREEAYKYADFWRGIVVVVTAAVL